MDIKQYKVKSISLCDFSNKPTKFFNAYQWINGEGIFVEFSSDKQEFFISISDLMYDDILSFPITEDLFIDYNEKFLGNCLKNHRLIINNGNTIILRIQNQYSEQYMEFKDLNDWNAFLSIIKHFKNIENRII
tara:strand:- start:11368 stop:11766 length:399 start_codon:yes stop_codon:yes gene_type:complete